ncbi:MAG TPA: aldo/keto reductase, partial [Paraburkholderia sp.]
MAFSSDSNEPRIGRRRFLRTASGAAIGLPVSLAVPRLAAGQTQPQAQTQAQQPLPRMAQRVIPSTGER